MRKNASRRYALVLVFVLSILLSSFPLARGQEVWDLHDHLFEIPRPYAVKSGSNAGNLPYVWSEDIGGWTDPRRPALSRGETTNAWGMLVKADVFNDWVWTHWQVKNQEIVQGTTRPREGQVLMHPDWDNETVVQIPIDSGSLAGLVVSDFFMDVALPDAASNKSAPYYGNSTGVLLTIEALKSPSLMLDSAGETQSLIEHEVVNKNYWVNVRDIAGDSQYNRWLGFLSTQTGPNAIRITVAQNRAPCCFNHLELVLRLTLVRAGFPLIEMLAPIFVGVGFVCAPFVLKKKGKKVKSIAGLLWLIGFALVGFAVLMYLKLLDFANAQNLVASIGAVVAFGKVLADPIAGYYFGNKDSQ